MGGGLGGSDSILVGGARIMSVMRVLPACFVVSIALAASLVGCPEPPRDPASSSATSTSAKAGAAPSTSASGAGAAGEKIGARCGVVGATLCPAGYHCMDDPSDDCDPRKGSCPGVCAAAACGSKAACASGFECVDDPADACKPDEGHESCAGICVEGRALVRCGGVAGRSCPDGFRCIDDVADTCNPKLNPTCPGLCVKH